MARHAARLMAVVVFPTPPFWLTSPTIFPMAFQSKAARVVPGGACIVGNAAYLWKVREGSGRFRGASYSSGRALEHSQPRDYGKDKMCPVVENCLRPGGVFVVAATGVPFLYEVQIGLQEADVPRGTMAGSLLAPSSASNCSTWNKPSKRTNPFPVGGVMATIP